MPKAFHGFIQFSSGSCLDLVGKAALGEQFTQAPSGDTGQFGQPEDARRAAQVVLVCNVGLWVIGQVKFGEAGGFAALPLDLLVGRMLVG